LIICLKRKSYRDLVGRFYFSKLVRYIYVLHHFYGKGAFILLYFLIGYLSWSIIRNRGGKDSNVNLFKHFATFEIHFICIVDLNYAQARTLKLNVYWPRHNYYFRAQLQEFLCQGITHFSAGMIADVSNRVYCLTRRTGRYQNLFICKY